MKRPKPQPYPASRIKVGTILYEAFSYMDDGKAVTGFNEWVVRTIRARRNSISTYGIKHTHVKLGCVVPKMVNLTEKNHWTWGKLSTKRGDYGWRKNIPASSKKQIAVGSDLPYGIYTTKRAALTFYLAFCIDDLKDISDAIEVETDEADLADLKLELAEATALLTAVCRRAKALAAT